MEQEIPIRCFTCGKQINTTFYKIIHNIHNTSLKQLMDKNNLKRYCCRRMILGYIKL